MILITGGAFQGKRSFAESISGISPENMTDCAGCAPEALKNAGCIYNYEAAVRKMAESGIDPLAFSQELDCRIVIMNEIGSGIIPLDAAERSWRELTGRAGCIIAERADAVYRLCCGIPVRIK